MTQQMKPFSGYQNPNMMGFQPNRNPNNMMNFPIFNPMMSQNKPKPMNIFPFNHMNNMNTAYQRFKMAEVNKNIDNNEDRIKNILEGVDAPVILHDYLSRAYQKCINLADKNQMDKFLKKIINLARIQNEIHVRDWKNHPLPALPRERMEINQDNVFNFEIEETDEPISKFFW